jgi:histidine triad (HIT) family protein
MAFEEYKDDNIFQKIMKGDIPSFKVFDSKTSMAFLDAFPMAEGHTLVIPKSKSTCFLNMRFSEVTFFREVQKVANAVKTALGADAVKIVTNSGEAAGQTVFHTHFHIIPMFAGKKCEMVSAKEMIAKEAAEPIVAKITEALKPPPKPLKKAKFAEVAKINPDSKGLNLRVKVTGAAKAVESKGKTFHEATVADGSSAVVLSLTQDQLSLAPEGASIEVRNAKVIVVNGHIRVAVDKWGKIASSEEAVETVNTSKNVSDTEYELVKS